MISTKNPAARFFDTEYPFVVVKDLAEAVPAIADIKDNIAPFVILVNSFSNIF